MLRFQRREVNVRPELSIFRIAHWSLEAGPELAPFLKDGRTVPALEEIRFGSNVRALRKEEGLGLCEPGSQGGHETYKHMLRTKLLMPRT